MYLVTVKDFYADVLKNGLLEKMDTSNFPPNHPCYRTERKKVPGTFTDETGGKFIWEHVALRAKSYGFNLCGDEIIKAKGVTKTVVKNHLSIEDHKKCLFAGMDNGASDLCPYRDMRSFRSYHHEIKTILTRKLALNRKDDKRIVLEDQIHTLAYGHYSIK